MELLVFYLSNPKPRHTAGGSGRRTAGWRRGGAQRGGAGRGGMRRGGAGQGRPPAGRFAQETTNPHVLHGIEDNCPERLSGCTNKRNLIQSVLGVHDPCLNSGLLPGARALLVPDY